MIYRVATIKDIPTICQIRKQQLIDEGIKASINIDEELNSYFREKIEDESLLELLAEENGKIIATAAILFIEFPPSYTNESGIRAYITNIYTDPDYRNKGIGKTMLKKLIDEIKKKDIHQVFLFASKFGKPLYQQLGFVESEEYMKLDL